MTNLEFKGSKNMDSFKEHIQYWIDYDGSSEGYRKKHDLDCILTDGNLCADTLISLWLPLRYVLDKENTNKWKEYLKGEDKEHPLKKDKTFLKDLKNNIEDFIPTEELRQKVETLFALGRKRGNVIILPYRKWNSIKGRPPYWDYMPHFLYDLLNTDNIIFLKTTQEWVKEQNLCMFFKDENNLLIDNIKNLSGSKSIFKHRSDQIDINVLLDNYISILEKRVLLFA